MNICLIFNERPVLNWLRLVRTSNQSRPVLIGFLRSLISPVQFFEVLGLWWTGLGLGLSPWRSKTETGLDFQSLHVCAQAQNLTWIQLHGANPIDMHCKFSCNDEFIISSNTSKVSCHFILSSMPHPFPSISLSSVPLRPIKDYTS